MATETVSDELKELIIKQMPDPSHPVQTHPLVELLQELLDRIAVAEQQLLKLGYREADLLVCLFL